MDLIERLRERAEFEDKRVLDEANAMGFVPEVYTGSQTGALLLEAAAALEAARKDAERLDWLDANGSAVRLKGDSRRNLIIWDAVHVPSYRTIRHAIDHARGEEEGNGQ